MSLHPLQHAMLIAIEGIDGAGKSTLARHLSEELTNDGLVTLLTKEPGASQLGKWLRQQLQHNDFSITTKAEFLLFAADRSQHMTDIVNPALADNTIVISDRMYDSSVVYQGYGRGLSVDIINQVNAWVMEGKTADIVFYVRISLEDAKKRLALRGEKLSVFEQDEAFVQRIIDGFEQTFAHRANVIALDGSLPPEKLVAQAKEKTLTWLLNKKNR